MKRFLICISCMLSMSMTAFGAGVYPSKIEQVEGKIHKTYELGINESPDMIPTDAITVDGRTYMLRDILKTSTPEHETKEIKEPVTVESGTNKMEDILPLIPATKEVVTEDGFVGTLELDISSIQIESKGTGTSSYNMTATRTYPNLAGADLQYIPKTTVENGATLQFASVDWQSDNTANVDTHAITDRYTAVVTYEGTGTRSYSKGYIVTAEYRGVVSKFTDTVEYTAIFAQESILPAELELVLPVLLAGSVLACLGVLYYRKKKGAIANEEQQENVEGNTPVPDDGSDEPDDNYPGVCP